MNYCKALYAVCSVLPTNHGMNSLRYLAFLAYTVHARALHVTGIQYVFVKQNRKNWEKNTTEQNRTGEETQQNGGRNTTEWNETASLFTSRFHGTGIL